MTPSGDLFFVDEWGQQYDISWTTVGGQVDITTITRQPYVWGEAPSGKKVGHVVYKRGIITIIRQILQPFDGGYMVVAEGQSQYIDLIQTTFQCGTQPVDIFKYHLDSAVSDEVICGASLGPRWADPDDPNDSLAEWSDVAANGAPLSTPTSGATALAWIDVWSA